MPAPLHHRLIESPHIAKNYLIQEETEIQDNILNVYRSRSPINKIATIAGKQQLKDHTT
jgi:hypothetical protein